MTHVRYWALTVAAAAAGGFIAVDRFAFVPQHAIWIAFGVAIAAGVLTDIEDGDVGDTLRGDEG